MSDGIIEYQTYMAQGIPVLGTDGTTRDDGWGRFFEFQFLDPSELAGALIFSNIQDGMFAGFSFDNSTSGDDARFEGGYFAYEMIGVGGQFTFYLNSNIGTSTASLVLCLDSAGFVGIGTDAPVCQLDFGNFVGKKIALYSSGGVFQYGFEIANFEMRSHVDTVSTSGFHTWYGNNAERMRLNNSGLGIGSTPSIGLDVSSKTDAIGLPKGTNAQRPSSPADGMIRFNSDTNRVEAYYSGVWNNL